MDIQRGGHAVRKEWKLMLLGGMSPLIGVLFFLLQLQITPHGFVKYNVTQAIISIVYLSYFFLCAYFFSDRQQKYRTFCFFAVPIILFFVNIFINEIQAYAALAIIAEGVIAPFHYVLPYLYLNFPPLDEHLLMNALPMIACWISFKMGERVRTKKGRALFCDR